MINIHSIKIRVNFFLDETCFEKEREKKKETVNSFVAYCDLQ
jgi:hypothetical protein